VAVIWLHWGFHSLSTHVLVILDFDLVNVM